jgi:hypothetical protein
MLNMFWVLVATLYITEAYLKDNINFELSYSIYPKLANRQDQETEILHNSWEN